MLVFEPVNFMHTRSWSNRLRPSHNHHTTRFLRSIDRSIDRSVPRRKSAAFPPRRHASLLSFIPSNFRRCINEVSPLSGKTIPLNVYIRFFERKRIKRGKLLYNWYRGKDFKRQAFLERGRNRAFEDADVRELATSIESSFSWLCTYASNFSEVIDVRACPSREIYRELNEP